MKQLFKNLPGRQHLKNVILSVPGGRAAVESLLIYRKKQLLRRFKKPADVFTHHYNENFWNHDESRSGPGSTLAYTEHLRRELPRLIAALGIKSILDAPCGDYNWFRQVERGAGVRYIGADIVAPLIARNNEQFADDRTRFMVMDITSDAPPEADLWLCRDCLFHLPNADILRFLDNFRRSRVRYLLTTTYSTCEHNNDIAVGDFRGINLERPPFNLGPPLQRIDDWIPGHAVRHLGLWDRHALEPERR